MRKSLFFKLTAVLCLFAFLTVSDASAQANCPLPVPTYAPTFEPPVSLNREAGCHYNSQKHYFVDVNSWLNAAEPWGVNNKETITGAWWHVDSTNCNYNNNFAAWYQAATQTAFYQQSDWVAGQFQTRGEPVLLKTPILNRSETSVANLRSKSFGRSVNESDVVVGYSERGAGTRYRAFIWAPATRNGNEPAWSQYSDRPGKYSVDPVWDLGGTSNEHNFAFDVSNPIYLSGTSTPTDTIVAVGMSSNTATADPAVSMSDPFTSVLGTNTHAQFWTITASDLTAGVASLRSTERIARTLPAPYNQHVSEARAVNDVGTVVGTYLDPDLAAKRGFACKYPCAASGDVKVLAPLPGHNNSYAYDVNNWQTTASSFLNGPTRFNGLGQVFGFSESVNGAGAIVARKAVVWAWNAAANNYFVIELLPAGSGDAASKSSSLYAGNDFGVSAGILDSKAAVFRDGRAPVDLSKAIRLYDAAGSPVSLEFRKAFGTNQRGTVIVRGFGYHGAQGFALNLLLKPMYYDVQEITSRVEGPNSVPEAVYAARYSGATTYAESIVAGYGSTTGSSYTEPLWWSVADSAARPSPFLDEVPEVSGVPLQEVFDAIEAVDTPTYKAYAVQTAPETGGIPEWFVGAGKHDFATIGGQRNSNTSAYAWDRYSARYALLDRALFSDFTSTGAVLYEARGMNSSGIGVGNGLRVSSGAVLTGDRPYAFHFENNNNPCGVFGPGFIDEAACVRMAPLGVTNSGKVLAVNERRLAGGVSNNRAVVWNIPSVLSASTINPIYLSLPQANTSEVRDVNVPVPSDMAPSLNNAQRYAVVGNFLAGTPYGLVWIANSDNPTTASSFILEPAVQHVSNNVSTTTKLMKVNGLVQAVGYAQSKRRYFTDSNITAAGYYDTLTAVLYDKYNPDERLKEISSLISSNSEFIELISAAAIDDSGVIVGQGKKRDGTTAAFIARPPAETNPVCW